MVAISASLVRITIQLKCAIHRYYIWVCITLFTVMFPWRLAINKQMKTKENASSTAQPVESTEAKHGRDPHLSCKVYETPLAAGLYLSISAACSGCYHSPKQHVQRSEHLVGDSSLCHRYSTSVLQLLIIYRCRLRFGLPDGMES